MTVKRNSRENKLKGMDKKMLRQIEPIMKMNRCPQKEKKLPLVVSSYTSLEYKFHEGQMSKRANYRWQS